MSLAGVGPGGRTERDSISIRSFPSLPQSAPSICLSSRSTNDSLFLARTAALATRALYRIHSPTQRTIRATADGTAAPRSTSSEGLRGSELSRPIGTITGTVADDGGSNHDSEVTAVGTGRSAITNSLGRFSIGSVPPAWTGSLSTARMAIQPTSIHSGGPRRVLDPDAHRERVTTRRRSPTQTSGMPAQIDDRSMCPLVMPSSRPHQDGYDGAAVIARCA